MSLIRNDIRFPLARTIIAIAIVVAIGCLVLLIRPRAKATEMRPGSLEERRDILVATMDYIALEYSRDIARISVRNTTAFQEIDSVAAAQIAERVRRLGHELSRGWEAALTRVNSVSEDLPDDCFSSVSTRITVVRELSDPDLKIPDHHFECIVSAPLVIGDAPQTLAVVWYSSCGSHGGGNGVVVLSPTNSGDAWIVIQDTPLGVY